MTFAERLRKERKVAKMTQADLADKLGVTPTVIGQYERGVRNPKTETIHRIADVLGINPMRLVTVIRGELPVGAVMGLIKNVSKADIDGLSVEKPSNPIRAEISYLGFHEVYDNILNNAGKQKVVEYMKDLIKLNEYCNSPLELPKDGEPE